MKNKPLWSPDWSSAPDSTIGACFNADGTAWAWSVRPSIRGSDLRPWDMKWRGPNYGEGYSPLGKVPSSLRALWRESWVDKP